MEVPNPSEPTVERGSSAEGTRTVPASGVTDGSALPTVIRAEGAGTLPCAGPPSAPSTPRPFGRYLLERELGRGGMGVVWKAWDTQLSRHIALKQILTQAGADAEQVQRFIREARLAAKLRHPHILPVHDVGEHEGQHYFTTDYIEGRTLDADMQAPIAPRAAVAHARAIAEALAYAHENGVIHRDVKPTNVLLDAEGHAYVMDFGLAKEVDAAAKGASPLTVSGAILGTPRYMSPEQAVGAREGLSPATDQFSLGVLLHEMLTAKPLFPGGGMIEILQAVVHGDAPPPSRVARGIPADVDTICLKLLEKDPRHRYASMREAAADLGRWLDGRPIEARPLTFGDRVARGIARHKGGVAVAAALLLGAAVTIAWVMKNRDELVNEREQHGKATDRALTAEDALRKANLVAAVLVRWAKLGDTLKSAEEIGYDSGLHPKDRRRKALDLESRVAAFERDTPPDPTSRSAALAFGAWGRWLCGGGSDAVGRMQDAARLDPDVPYGPLMELLTVFAGLVDRTPVPVVTYSVGGVHFAPMPPEPPEAPKDRARMIELLARARGAKAWGREGADDIEAALRGLDALMRGAYVASETDLTRGLEAPELATFESALRLARGKARYFSRRFPEATEDFVAVAQARPRSAEAPYFVSASCVGQASLETSQLRDPRALLDRAIAEIDRALAISPTWAFAWEMRGVAGSQKAGWLAGHDQDPRKTLETVMHDMAEAARLDPESAGFHDLLGGAYTDRAEWLMDHGADPDPDFVLAIREFDRALALDATATSAACNRAITRTRLAEWRAAHGADPTEALRQTVADCDDVLRSDPESVDAYQAKGLALLALAGFEKTVGRSPESSCEAAAKAFAELTRLVPSFAAAFANQGSAWRVEAAWKVKQSEDPATAFDRAEAGCRECLRLDPTAEVGTNGLGNVLLEKTMWMISRGADPRATLSEAATVFEGAVRDHPGSADLANGLACAYFYRAQVEAERSPDRTKWLEKAIGAYDTSLRINESQGEPYFNRAYARRLLANEMLERKEDAVEVIQKALADAKEAATRNPQDAEAWWGYGQTYVSAGRSEEAHGKTAALAFRSALKEFTRAVALDPGFVQARLDKAWMHSCFEEYAEAVKEYEAVLRIDPSLEQVARLLETAKAKMRK